jgi:hypothetical protein
VVIGQEARAIGVHQNRLEEGDRNVAIQQPIAIFDRRRRRPNGVV